MADAKFFAQFPGTTSIGSSHTSWINPAGSLLELGCCSLGAMITPPPIQRTLTRRKRFIGETRHSTKCFWGGIMSHGMRSCRRRLHASLTVLHHSNLLAHLDYRTSRTMRAYSSADVFSERN